ncbi:MAG: VWA domain-containing protein [Oscillospiraceae bacterium]|nr:VWA domain-containing protein [Oscillospiraceae bacterium]
MSKKKTNGNQQADNAASSNENVSAQGAAAAVDDDTPGMSLGEMLAFAQQTEEMEEKEKTAKEEAKPENTPKPENTESSERPEAKPEESSKPESPIKADTASAPKPSGPPITEEERRRREAAEDALDRDLNIARSKKLKEEEYNRRKLDEAKQRENEMLEKAAQAKKRNANAKAMNNRASAAVSAASASAAVNSDNSDNAQTVSGAVSHGSKPVKRRSPFSSFNNTLMSMAAGRFFAVLVIILAVCYVGAFIYIGTVNDALFEQMDARLTGQSKLVTDSSIEYEVPKESPYTLDEKTAKGLSAGLADTDKDGLTDYYEINTSGTDPKNPDSDGDGVTDGAEVRAELDPLSAASDGDTPDNAVLKDAIIAGKQVSARIKDVPKTAYITLEKLENNSIQGTPGIVGEAYEFYSNKRFDSCELSFTYTDEQLRSKNIAESALTVVRFDPDKLAFEMIAGQLNAESNFITATISENGIYALFDRAVLLSTGETKIFFLIDNSGSMYPEELCAGSEENDVEFKRLDFAVNLIDLLGKDFKYGAGEFSGGYSNIVPISGNQSDVKKKISDIRNKAQTFSGTEIAGAITNAVKEFGSSTGYDRNYIILLTDGMPSNYNASRENAAVEAAKNAGITIFTIGLGKYIDAGYLYDIAEETHGQFFQASNADALENIYDKISSFMSYNQVTIEEETGRKGYIVADSGFNVVKDGLGYANFRSDFAPNGTDVGISGLIRAYYRGELATTAAGYTTSEGKEIPGYDISSVEGFTDGRVDLKNVEIDILKAYNDYNARKDKWNYRSIKGGVLHYTNETRDFLESAGLKVTTAPCSFEVPEENGFIQFIRTITFNKIKPFTQYECVLIDSSLCTGDDEKIMDMLRWYNSIPQNSSRCRIYDFGYQGDDAFDALFSELSTGSPAVITYGGSAMNAVRVIRDANEPDKYVLDAYDSNSPDRSTRINITRSPVYNEDGTTSFQYTASRGTEEEPLRIIVMN